MQVITKEKAVYTFNSEHKPIAAVEDGEVFWVEVEDAYKGQIDKPSIHRCDIDSTKTNFSTGPITVKGAKPGDVVCIEFLKFEFGKQGVMPTAVGMGLFGDRIKDPTTRIIPVHDGIAYFSDEIRLPLTPMCGVCAVAPAPGVDLRCIWPGVFGGNMDTTKIKTGSKLYLNVINEGANLFIGDFHACMGDGEVSGTAIETPGRALIRVTIRRDVKIVNPVVETDEAIYFLASAETLDEAVKMSVSDALDYIVAKLGIDWQDAYRLFSAACDTQISQVVDPLKTARARVPRLHDKLGQL